MIRAADGQFSPLVVYVVWHLAYIWRRYHLQTWDETAEGFQKALDSLFRFTPPTALFVEEAPFVTATFQYCMKHGLRIPDDLSLICTDPDPGFQWCFPSIAHIRWEGRQMIRRVVRWVENIRVGKDDRKKGLFNAAVVEGGTIGPARGSGAEVPPVAPR